MAQHKFDDILDKCLEAIQSQQATLDACLEKYPSQADELRPLLQTTIEVASFSQQIANQDAYHAGKLQMLAALTKNTRYQRPSLAKRFRDLVKEYILVINNAAQFRKRFFALPLVALTVMLIPMIGGSTLLQSSPTGLVPQMVGLDEIVGDVNIKMTGTSAWQPATHHMQLRSGDHIYTNERSSVTLTFFDGSQTTLFPNTAITVSELSARKDGSHKIISLHQWWGQTVNRVERLLDSGSRYEIETPTAVTTVRGTIFYVGVLEDGTTQVDVVEGIVDVTAENETVGVERGQSTSVRAGSPPAPAGPTKSIPDITAELEDTDNDNDDDENKKNDGSGANDSDTERENNNGAENNDAPIDNDTNDVDNVDVDETANDDSNQAEDTTDDNSGADDDDDDDADTDDDDDDADDADDDDEADDDADDDDDDDDEADDADDDDDDDADDEDKDKDKKSREKDYDKNNDEDEDDHDGDDHDDDHGDDDDDDDHGDGGHDDDDDDDDDDDHDDHDDHDSSIVVVWTV